MWFLPTYERPARCRAALASIAASGPSRGVVWIDGGDLDGYGGLNLPDGWALYASPNNRGVCGALNAALRQYPDEPWYGFISDDSLVRTPGWSDALARAAGSNGFANSGDGWQANRRMHGAVAFGGDLVRALGFWAPPALQHCFVDDAWERLAGALDNWTHVPQVLVEHCHRGNGKADDDPVYRKAYASFEDDRRAFGLWLRDGLPGAVERAIPLVADNPERGRRMRARSRRPMIASPIARQPAFAYTLSLAESLLLLQREGIDCARHFVIGASNLPAARNQLCAAFLASGCTDLIMIDDDMGWQANALMRLLASPQPFAAIVGRKKCPAPNSDAAVWCGRPTMDDDGGALVQDEMGFVEFDKVGTGLVKIAREVFDRIAAAHPEWKAVGKAEMSDAVRANYYRFFRFGDDEYEAGEDFAFCEAWRALGGRIFVDVEQKISHVGEHDYAGAFAEIMRGPE